MNELWIIASYSVATGARGSKIPLEEFEYLDAVGLYETGWMIFDHLTHPANYGYPDAKRT